MDEKNKITWEEALVIRKWFCMDELLLLRNTYNSDSLGYAIMREIIDKIQELYKLIARRLPDFNR